jgi:polysaccharide pyruvyl transferase WcaK-like protein
LTKALRGREDAPARVLLVGYNGANNTGSEARLLEIIGEVREVMGKDTLITVPTLNEDNLRRYLNESDTLRIAPIPSIFFFELKRLVREHDLMMLVEGSCYMDTWTSALLWAFLSATKYAHSSGIPSLAYAVDAGSVSPSNQRRVKREASKTDLIITRTNAAAGRLREWGVTSSIEVGADNAFMFHLEDDPKDHIRRAWPESSERLAGIAPVNFHLWPVVMRPCGRGKLCYRWPYYYSHSTERKRATEELAGRLAGEADRLVERHDMSIALMAMEALDEPLARQVIHKMRHPDRARVFSSNGQDASEMTFILRDLELLITSRYHASVLSLASGVPQLAIGHDLRLRDLYDEMGIVEDRFMSKDSPRLWEWLPARVDEILSRSELERERLLAGNRRHVERAARNKDLLRRFVEDHGVIG